jgi:hypothetical protein
MLKGIKKLISVIALFLLFQQPAKAQLIDTIKYSLHQKPKFFFMLASFNTFIDKQFANIGGVRMGLNYNQRVRFGVGFFNLTNNAVVTPLNIKENQLDYITNGQLYFSFASLSAEYFFFNKYPWQCTFTPFQMGFGRAKYGYISRPDRIKAYTPSETIILYQPEISAQYNVFKWLGAGVSTGYRFTLLRSRKATKDLNAATFALDIRIFLDQVYKLLLKKE